MCRRVRYEAMARVGVLVQLLVVYDGRLGACVISKVVATFNGLQVATSELHFPLDARVRVRARLDTPFENAHCSFENIFEMVK